MPSASSEERSTAEAVRFGALSHATKTPYLLLWFGGFVSVVFGLMILVVIANSEGSPTEGVLSSTLAVGQLPDLTPALADRTNCAEIGRSDLQSPSEGLWFQSNCLAIPELPLTALTTNCNRTFLDRAEFIEVSPGLHVFRQSQASRAYLWYASSDACFDLVSTRVVTAICTDRTVSFDWKTSVCSANGGVLAWVNGR